MVVVRALKNSQLTDGDSHVIYGTGHEEANYFLLAELILSRKFPDQGSAGTSSGSSVRPYPSTALCLGLEHPGRVGTRPHRYHARTGSLNAHHKKEFKEAPMGSPRLLGRKERVSDIRNAHPGLGIVPRTASCRLSFELLALLFFPFFAPFRGYFFLSSLLR
jgi:hypothetical protein